MMSCNTSSSSPVPFELPDGWTVEKRSRSTSERVDTYYFEPGTGKQFRSLASIQKHLNGETNAARTVKRAKVGNEKNKRVAPFMFNSSEFNLPDEWEVQEIPRKNINYEGKIDKYYIEPGSGKRFRSLLSVARYLEGEEGNERPPTPKFKSVDQLYPSTKKRNSDSKVKASAVDLSTPPAKVKWVLNGPWGNEWNAFVGDSSVPFSMKQKWSHALSTTLNN